MAVDLMINPKSPVTGVRLKNGTRVKKGDKVTVQANEAAEMKARVKYGQPLWVDFSGDTITAASNEGDKPKEATNKAADKEA